MLTSKAARINYETLLHNLTESSKEVQHCLSDISEHTGSLISLYNVNLDAVQSSKADVLMWEDLEKNSPVLNKLDDIRKNEEVSLIKLYSVDQEYAQTMSQYKAAAHSLKKVTMELAFRAKENLDPEKAEIAKNAAANKNIEGIVDTIKKSEPKHFKEFENTKNLELINGLMKLTNEQKMLSQQLDTQKQALPKFAEYMQSINEATMKSFNELKTIGSPEHEVRDKDGWKKAIDQSIRKTEPNDKASKEMIHGRKNRPGKEI